MFGKIIPKVFSGGKKLILSESICFLHKEGIEIKIPSTNSDGSIKDLTFRFDFKYS